jgi:hypothetical protein
MTFVGMSFLVELQGPTKKRMKKTNPCKPSRGIAVWSPMRPKGEKSSCGLGSPNIEWWKG